MPEIQLFERLIFFLLIADVISWPVSICKTAFLIAKAQPHYVNESDAILTIGASTGKPRARASKAETPFPCVRPSPQGRTLSAVAEE